MTTVVVCNPADAQVVQRALRALGVEVAVSVRDTVSVGEVHRLSGSLDTLAPVLRALR